MPKETTNKEKNYKPGPGRPKGLKNKIPIEIKARVLHVWEKLQGNKGTALLGVAQNDPRWFYEIFGRLLLPKAVEVTGKDGNPIEHQHTGVIGLMDRQALQDAIAARRKSAMGK